MKDLDCRVPVSEITFESVMKNIRYKCVVAVIINKNRILSCKIVLTRTYKQIMSIFFNI